MRWFILRKGSSVFHGDLCSNLMRYVSCFVQCIYGYLTGFVRGNSVGVIGCLFEVPRGKGELGYLAVSLEGILVSYCLSSGFKVKHRGCLSNGVR